MHIAFKFLIALLITFSAAFADQPVATSTSNAVDPTQCVQPPHKDTLIAGWYQWEPYQFQRIASGGESLSGLDVRLVQILARNLALDVKYDEVSWKQHQLDLQSGVRDIAAGATYTDARAEYAYFSIPYRYEEDSLFTRQDSKKELSFANIKEFLAQIRLQNYRIGVIKGFTYAALEINSFIADSANDDIVVSHGSDTDNLQSLMRGEVDGFLADRVVGAAAILNNQLQHTADPIVKEIPLNIKTPIHLMFSKKTVPLDVVEKFNQGITGLIDTDRFKDIIAFYLYPVLLQQTINADWFYVVSVIGTIAFALSGIAIAAKENSTLFGTLLFAMLPSVGGGVMRDIMLNPNNIGILLNPSYMYYVIIIVLIGFVTIRLLNKYNQNADEDSIVGKFWSNLLMICDSIGQSAFIITGVTIAIMGRIAPIELWGPFFAFLTANGGGILRDLIRKDRVVTCISGEINAEISVIWGFLFAMFLSYSASNPNLDEIKYAVVTVVCGSFLTRMLAHYLKIPNLRFRPD